MPTPPKWTDAEVKELFRLHAKELSHAETGRALGKTRAAVSSKCRRAGLKHSAAIVAEKQRRLNPTYRKTAKPAPEGHRRVAVPFAPLPPMPSFDIVPLSAIPLMQRSSAQCAWPVGTPVAPHAQLCCGAHIDQSAHQIVASYCADHVIIATGAKPRKAARIGIGLKSEIKRAMAA